MSLMDDLLAQVNAQAPPKAPYIASKPLPSFSDLQSEIEALTEQLSKMPPLSSSMSPTPFITSGMVRRSLESRLAEKQKILDSLTHPSRNTGVSPAPEGPAILGPRIATPKTGLDDLKIFLPR